MALECTGMVHVAGRDSYSIFSTYTMEMGSCIHHSDASGGYYDGGCFGQFNVLTSILCLSLLVDVPPETTSEVMIKTDQFSLALLMEVFIYTLFGMYAFVTLVCLLPELWYNPNVVLLLRAHAEKFILLSQSQKLEHQVRRKLDGSG